MSNDTSVKSEGNEPMSFLITLLLIFALFAVAGWGWRFTKRR